MKTIEQTALEVSLPIDRYKLGTVGVIELCTRFLAAWLAQQEPVAWAATSDEGKVEALGFNESRRFDTPLFLAPPPAVPEWQPIETAPKDTFLLLRGPSGYTTTPFVCTTGRMCSDYHVGRWIDHANDDLTDWGFEPTHWQPLPKPPAQGEQE